MTALAIRTRYIALKPFSRRWWALWFHLASRGMPTAAMARAATRGEAWQVQAGEDASDIGFVSIRIPSAELTAWQAYWAERGVSLPMPRKCPVVSTPTRMPIA
jgi:hypothetical protein